MAKSISMKQLPQWKKIVDRQQQQPSAKGVVITRKCKSFVSKNSWPYKKEMMNNYIRKSGSGSSSSTSRCRGKMNKSKDGNNLPASIHLLVSLIDCVAIQGGLSFSGFIVLMLLVIVAASLFGLFEYLKMWRWLRMHQLRKSKNIETRSTTRTTLVLGIIEDLVSGVDVSGIDDLFITTCILVGLGFLCGFVVILRNFHSKRMIRNVVSSV